MHANQTARCCKPDLNCELEFANHFGYCPLLPVSKPLKLHELTLCQHALLQCCVIAHGSAYDRVHVLLYYVCASVPQKCSWRALRHAIELTCRQATAVWAKGSSWCLVSSARCAGGSRLDSGTLPKSDMRVISTRSTCRQQFTCCSGISPRAVTDCWGCSIAACVFVSTTGWGSLGHDVGRWVPQPWVLAWRREV